VTIGEGSVALRTAIRRLLARARTRSCSTCGRRLYRFERHRRAGFELYCRKERGRHAQALNLTQKIQDLLAITKLLTVFERSTRKATL
jgi:hypothetical protein